MLTRSIFNPGPTRLITFVCIGKSSFPPILKLPFVIKFFSILQQLNKLFLRSAYGKIRADDVTSIMETALPGFTSYMLDCCPVGKADAVAECFAVEELFGVVTKGCVLDFDSCCGLLDLSVEVKRQADERQRLFESFADPHPNIIFGQLKQKWFSELVYNRISATNYHVTFVSSERFIEVNFDKIRSRFILFSESRRWSLFKSIGDCIRSGSCFSG